MNTTRFRFHIALVLGAVLGAIWSFQVQADAHCENKQLRAGAQFCAKTLRCEAKFVRTATKDGAAEKRDLCRDKAILRFERQYDMALNKKNAECELIDDKSIVADELLGDIDALSELILTGADLDDVKASKLYGNALGAASGNCAKPLRSIATHIVKPDLDTLLRRQAQARNALIRRLENIAKTADRKGINYTGADPTVTADTVDQLVGEYVNRVGTVITAGNVLAMGADHACSTVGEGELKCWGGNNAGQLGLGDLDARGDQTGEMGNDLSKTFEDPHIDVVKVVAGVGHTCALLKDGNVKCWGDNGDGQLGLGDTMRRGDDPGEMGDNLPVVDLGLDLKAMDIAAGSFHICALLDNGAVKCWGRNNAGQLGLSDTMSRGDEIDEMGDNLSEVDLGTDVVVVALAAGANHSCARFIDRTIKCWGGNESGQLGLGDTQARGDAPDEMGDNLPTVPVGGGGKVRELVAGASHTCARLATNRVKCWGRNNAGQLGRGDTDNRGDNKNEMGSNLPVIDLGSLAPEERAVQVVAGKEHTCARFNTGKVKCWGANNDGQLGLGDSENRGDGADEMGDNLPFIDLGSDFAVRESAAAGSSTCGLSSANKLKCWGRNEFGQLGLGDTNDRGDAANEMGDNLPVIDLGTP